MPTSMVSLARAIATMTHLIATSATLRDFGSSASHRVSPSYHLGLRRLDDIPPIFRSSSMTTRRIRRGHVIARSLILRGGGGSGYVEENDDDLDDEDDAIRDVRGCSSSAMTSQSSIPSSTSGDGAAAGVAGGRVEDDPWEGEIRRTREYYAAASSTTASPSISSTSSASHSSAESFHLVEDSSAAESMLLADEENAEHDDADVTASHATTNAEDGRVLGCAQIPIVEAGDAGFDAMGDVGEVDGVEPNASSSSSSSSSSGGGDVSVDDCARDDDVVETKGGDYWEEESEPPMEGMIAPRSEDDDVVVVVFVDDDDAVIPRAPEGDDTDATMTGASGHDAHDGEMSNVHGSVADVTSSWHGGDGDDLAKVDVDDIENDDDREDGEGPRGDSVRYDRDEGARIVAKEDEIAVVDMDDIDEDDSNEIDNSGMIDAVTTVAMKSIGDRDENADDAEIATDAVYDDDGGLSVLRLVEEGLRRLERTNGVDPSVLYVITRAMHRVLVDDLGYAPDEVESMRPDVAVVLVAEGLERPKNIDSLPPRFYPDPGAVMDEVPVDKSMGGYVPALTRGIHKYRKRALPIILASLGVGLSFMVASNRGNEESSGVAVQAAREFQTIDDASPGHPYMAPSGDKESDEEDDKAPTVETGV